MAFQPFSNKEIRRFFSFFWLFYFLVFQLVYIFFFHLHWLLAFTDNMVTIILLIVAIGIANRKNYVINMNQYKFIPGFLVLTFLSILCIAVNLLILYYAVPAGAAYHQFLLDSVPFRFLYSWFLIVGFTFMNYIWHKSTERTKEQKKAEDLRKMAKDAELDKIYQQLHPHFLFNSLNAINTLIVSRPEKASHMVQNLSDFLRRSLKKVNKEHISFQEEIDHLSLYLKLEEIRFGDRLKTRLQINKNTENATIPPLILQPLIENAIKFGVYGTLGEVHIRLKSFVFRNYLNLMVSNPFDEDAQPPRGTGFGLKSVKRRLFLIYGRKDLIQTHKRNNNFITILKIPQNEN